LKFEFGAKLAVYADFEAFNTMKSVETKEKKKNNAQIWEQEK
jgi:hypothetical protein